MRKHGWQLPYHPLQVVAVSVFLALGFAFCVFFAPFVGKKILQYVVTGIYTLLVGCVFGLYIWCAAADPADPGVFKSKKYLHLRKNGKHTLTNNPKLSSESNLTKNSKLRSECNSPLPYTNSSITGGKSLEKGVDDGASIDTQIENNSSSPCSMALLALVPCAVIHHCCSTKEESMEQQTSEDGMFYCSLCEVEVFKHSKHCRVCDKCVDQFDHHCRWLNNCIGKKNYRKFFTLMVSSTLLLILQWATGILVLICCFLERKQFSADVATKLGSSFTLVPFVIVVAVCTILAMIATLPLAQLFFFHILLIKKGISTYDYIIALREQEQEQQGAGDQQSQQMSPASSLTGLSSASSFTTFHRGAWCTPPRLFVEDQFDVVPPETGSVISLGKKMAGVEPIKRKNPGAVKISPWALARLNAEDVSKAAAEARKKSKILLPVVRRDSPFMLNAEHSSSSGRRMVPRPDNNRRRTNKRVRIPADLPLDPISPPSKVSTAGFIETSTSLAPLQHEARSAFQTTRAMSISSGVVASSPDSSLESPDIHPFRVSSYGPEDARQLTLLSATNAAAQKGILFSRSTSDGYDASGGEDSDQVPSRFVQRSRNWSNLLFGTDPNEGVHTLKASSSSYGYANNRKL